jgi:hypothetical protein
MSKFDRMNEALKSPVDAEGYPITHPQWIEAQECISELEAEVERYAKFNRFYLEEAEAEREYAHANEQRIRELEQQNTKLKEFARHIIPAWHLWSKAEHYGLVAKCGPYTRDLVPWLKEEPEHE